MDGRMVITGAGALMQRVRTGDKAALREFVTKYGGSIYSAALQRTGNPLEARAIAKATLLDIIETPWCEDADDAYAAWIGGLIERNAWQSAGARTAPASDTVIVENEKRAPSVRTVAVPSAAPVPEAPAQEAFLPPRQARSSMRQKPPAFDEIWSELEGDVSAPAPAKDKKKKRKRNERSMHALWYDENTAAPEDKALSDEIADESYQKKSRSRRGEMGEKKKKAPARIAGQGILTAILCIIIVVLVWGILGVLSGMGLLPALPLGYDWFNQNVFPLF